MTVMQIILEDDSNMQIQRLIQKLCSYLKYQYDTETTAWLVAKTEKASSVTVSQSQECCTAKSVNAARSRNWEFPLAWHCQIE